MDISGESGMFCGLMCAIHPHVMNIPSQIDSRGGIHEWGHNL